MEESAYEYILFDVEDGVATITLNRPHKMNAFHFPLGAELQRAYARCDEDDAVRVVILTGAGKAFCAGADMGGGEDQFEWITPVKHHHLICRTCDRVVLLDHKYVEALGGQVVAKHGFVPDIDHLALFGTCKECLEDSSS